jgi:outer membrane protein insertion porin family
LGEGAVYRSVLGRPVITGRIRVGWSRPLGETTDVVANRRFYAGGYNSMRGYGRRQLGPRDLDGNARGGQTVILGSAELRFPFFWKLDGAVFLDSGQVWRTPTETNLGDLEVATGLAVDFRSPLGPLRLGYAWNLTTVTPGQPQDLFHFGIGFPW